MINNKIQMMETFVIAEIILFSNLMKLLQHSIQTKLDHFQ